MGDKVVKPERRRFERRRDRLATLGEVVSEVAWSERRTHCWDLDPECTEERRKKCSAHFVRRNCWDLWATEYFPRGRKPCCHPDQDCSGCPIATTKFGNSISVYVEVPRRSGGRLSGTPVDGRIATYCRHLYSSKDPPGLRADGESRVHFKCQRRPGITLHSTYVSEVCGTTDHQQCIFGSGE